MVAIFLFTLCSIVTCDLTNWVTSLISKLGPDSATAMHKEASGAWSQWCVTTKATTVLLT